MFTKTNTIAILAGVAAVYGIFGTTSAKAGDVVYVSGGVYAPPVRTVVYQRPVVYHRPVYYRPATTVVYSRPYCPPVRRVVHTYAAGPRYYRSYGRGVSFSYNRGYYGRGIAVGARW